MKLTSIHQSIKEAFLKKSIWKSKKLIATALVILILLTVIIIRGREKETEVKGEVIPKQISVIEVKEDGIKEVPLEKTVKITSKMKPR